MGSDDEENEMKKNGCHGLRRWESSEIVEGGNPVKSLSLQAEALQEERTGTSEVARACDEQCWGTGTRLVYMKSKI